MRDKAISKKEGIRSNIAHHKKLRAQMNENLEKKDKDLHELKKKLKETERQQLKMDEKIADQDELYVKRTPEIEEELQTQCDNVMKKDDQLLLLKRNHYKLFCDKIHREMLIRKQ